MANEEIQKIDLVTRELDESVLNPIKETNGKLQQLVNVFGQLYLRKKELEDELVKLEEGVERAEEDFKKHNEELRGLVSELEKEYPGGQLNLEKGTVTFNPEAKKAAESKE